MPSPGCQVHSGSVVACAEGSDGVRQLGRAAPAGEQLCLVDSAVFLGGLLVFPARQTQFSKGIFLFLPHT